MTQACLIDRVRALTAARGTAPSLSCDIILCDDLSPPGVHIARWNTQVAGPVPTLEDGFLPAELARVTTVDEAPQPGSPAPPAMIPRSLIERRITDAEDDAYEQALAALPRPKKRLWMTVTEVRCDDPEVAALLAASLGAERAAEIMAPASPEEIALGYV